MNESKDEKSEFRFHAGRAYAVEVNLIEMDLKYGKRRLLGVLSIDEARHLAQDLAHTIELQERQSSKACVICYE